MNDYMRALHQRFYREPDFSELEEDIENTARKCVTAWQAAAAQAHALGGYSESAA